MKKIDLKKLYPWYHGPFGSEERYRKYIRFFRKFTPWSYSPKLLTQEEYQEVVDEIWPGCNYRVVLKPSEDIVGLEELGERFAYEKVVTISGLQFTGPLCKYEDEFRSALDVLKRACN